MENMMGKREVQSTAQPKRYVIALTGCQNIKKRSNRRAGKTQEV